MYLFIFCYKEWISGEVTGKDTFEDEGYVKKDNLKKQSKKEKQFLLPEISHSTLSVSFLLP